MWSSRVFNKKFFYIIRCIILKIQTIDYNDILEIGESKEFM